MNEKKIVWHTEKRKLSELKKWKDNPRKITKENYTRLKERILKRGFHDILKIDIDNTVLSGNQRLEALKECGYKEIDCKVPNRKLTEEEKQQVSLESNISDGEWDLELLKGFDEELLSSVGFEDEKLD